MKEEKIVYFESPGKQNTDATLKLAKERADKLKIKNVIVASTSGFTAEKAVKAFNGMTLVIIGIDRKSFCPELIKKLEIDGHQVRFSQEVTSSYPELAKTVLRRFCEGMKVVVQITLIAADERLVPLGKEVIAIAGTTHEVKEVGGSDTAIVVEPKASDKFNELKVREVICKPR